MFIISIENNLCVRHATKFVPINFILILIRQGRRMTPAYGWNLNLGM